jgi:hypothetical protein
VSAIRAGCFVSGFNTATLLYVDKEATEPRVPFGKAEVIISKFNGRHHDLVDRYGISVSQMITDMFHLS